MRDTNDGFIIAEKDLQLRGGGEILGTKQSGQQSFNIFDLEIHKELIYKAEVEAEEFLKDDPLLKSKRGKAIKTLLHLHEKEKAIDLLSSG